MAITAHSGPLVAFGAVAAPGEYNPDRGPSLFDQGTALLDPRAPFTYTPGQRAGQPTYGFLNAEFITIDAVPSTLSAVNIAAAQVPVAGTAMTLVSSSAAGITVATSITNASTGATVTGLLAIDTAMGGVLFGDAVNGSVNIWDPTKSIARNVRITSAGNDSGGTFVVAGYDLYGYPMTETITGANATVASGKKAFKYIASVTPAGTMSGSNASVGTGDVFGFPIRVDRFAYSYITWNNGAITASTGLTVADTTSPATGTTGDVRGTYNVQSASDGTKRLQVFISVPVANVGSTTGLFGVAQV